MLDAQTSQEAIGVCIAPDGNNTEHIKFLRLKASKWATRSRLHHILIYKSIRDYTTTIEKLLTYPLIATTLIEDKCVTDQWLAITQLLDN